MKRSEIIRLIQKEIYSITQDDILYDSFGFSRNLLDKLESAGMLPPSQMVWHKTEYTDHSGRDVKYKKVVNEWEPEDE